jgi:hypothetical protein
MATSMPVLRKRPDSEQLALRSDVVSNPTVINSTEGSHSMAIGSRVHYVEDRNSARDDRIGDQ